ncbi:hypothetical protein MFERI14815_00681 [Mycoplasma feriruminatoris]|uniref:LppA family lipoprotein n=1 Tax=Mycoplasma feriruminatoris TaxID=1179777 RepID=A0ABY8HVV1_9MOLU|nr:LppA family lipoprotein [Mycoplasma feriruminatoris]WFQ92065.1 hypothetical protein MFERI14815_00681 [Mycoplasma feriruminatoris]WFQ93755.1 LppA family lipoprotein [Mycoplasma feriruminatoris]
MRKFSKLILAILPVSSLTVFSVISCSTNDKKPVEIPKTPNNKTPDNQPKKPENKPDKENHNIDKPGEEKQTDGEPSPGMPDEQPSPSQPENKPHNPETQPRQPKEPMTSDDRSSDSNNNSNEEPQGDDPNIHLPNSQPNINNIDFLDLDSLKKEIEFQYYSIYKNKDALSAWIEIKARKQTIFKEVIFSKNTDILNKYNIEFDNQNNPEINKKEGKILKVKIKFTKDGNSKVYEFIFTGFKKDSTKIEKTINKSNYITSKKNIDEKISGLYPSLVAYMLLYVEEDHNNNKYDTKIKKNGNVINFDELKNKNQNLFNKRFSGFNVGTKELLFDYKDEYKKIYKDRIVHARYDDVEGILELEVQISNTDEHNDEKNPTITKKFSFTGFKKVDFKNNKNALSISLDKRGLKKLVDEKNLEIIIKQLNDHNFFNKKIPIADLNQNNLKNKLFEKLIVNVDGDADHLYNSNQTLTIDNRNQKETYKSILGLKDNMSLYPFHTRITKDSITNVSVSINKKQNLKELEIEVEIEIPIYSSTLSDLTDNVYAKETKLKLKFKQNINIT